jgi:hypothetical protein
MEYLSRTYQKITSKQRFGKPTSYPTDTTHNQVCRRNQGFQHGIQLSLIQNIFVGLKYAGQNLQEVKDIGKPFVSQEKTLGWI